MDSLTAKKASDQAKILAEKLFLSAETSKEEKLQMLTAIEAAIFLLGRQAPPIQIARLHCLAAKCFLKVQEYGMALWHAQLSEFQTKSAPDRRLIDEIFSLDVLGRSQYLRGQMEKSKDSLNHANSLLEKLEVSAEIEHYRKYIQVLETAGLPMANMEPSS